jgi:Domain of unknown function (DUF4747)
MARKKKVEVAACNVRIHPHPPGAYGQLLRDAFTLRRAVRVRGDTYMILGSLDTRGDVDQDVLQGALIKFTQIDVDAPWFNLETFTEADEDQLTAVHIPENLRPNMVSMYFALFISQHLFVFEHYSEGKVLSARQVTVFLSRLLQDERLQGRYGTSDVSAVADREGVAEVLNIYALRSLVMTIMRPNSDTLAGLTRDIQARLQRQNARQLQQRYDVVPGQALSPDEETRELADVAAQNGEVVASGRDEDGIVQTRSTKDHPAIEAERFDPDVTSARAAFLNAARRLARRIAERLSE